ncbi:Rsc8p SCDLUD_000389 [Saccharomycodes ludwigii]|uniref:Rsc8p n=1 Tax=Saccharomycodes ludwigii TaxID=36035 RepID=UPI001E8B0601|nr:hypothetical protein SCDLUD_000389 [Saccharomycodes ludwigii]KAH3902798.1 hypothetical protein SCDLUD_000389 [Saccharomycodes ludwigii]
MSQETTQNNIPSVEQETNKNDSTIDNNKNETFTTRNENTTDKTEEISSTDVNASKENTDADFNATVATDTLPAQQVPKPDYESEAAKLEQRAVKFLATQAHPIILPSFAAWFDISLIHDIERNYFPEFFNNKNSYNNGSSIFKTSKIYKDVRDFIVNTYRLNPLEYLTITAVRRNLAMDVGSIVKIHQFLEKWGIINYQIDPKTKPSLVGPHFTGHFQILLDTPTGLKPYIRKDEFATDNDDSTAISHPINLSLKKTVYSNVSEFNSLDSQVQHFRKYICHSCGNEAVKIHYHNLRSRSENLCSKCFKEGHFSNHFHSSDFIKLDNNINVKNHATWSDQEVLLLLEGIDMFSANWEKIARHTGRSKEDCVLKFIELPVEDEYINKLLPPKKKQTSITSNSLEEAVKLLIENLNDENKNKIIKNSNELSTKYLNESQAIAQELVYNKLQQLDTKMEKINGLEETMLTLKTKYINVLTELQSDKVALLNDVETLNQKLKSLNIDNVELLKLKSVREAEMKALKAQHAKKVNLDKQENEDGNDEDNSAKLVVKSISLEAPQAYKAWSL